MKIYSKFQDYYDSALGSFLESDVVFNRKTEEIEILQHDYPSLCETGWHFTWFNGNDRFAKDFEIHLLGFCGKWYFFYYDENCDIVYIDYNDIVKNYSERFSFLKNNPGSDFHNPNDIKEWTEDIFVKYGPVLYIEKYRCPSKYWTKSPQDKLTVVKMPFLKQLKFHKIKDPFTALYELEHWYDSHARPDDAIVPVGDDVTRLQAYGFDKKTSFRKPKETK